MRVDGQGNKICDNLLSSADQKKLHFVGRYEERMLDKFLSQNFD